ncbi:MAG TPA: 3-phosphoserine/phosphohydroxythreonine transaminase [Polyangiaceae bacterium]|jgi:phosphoserine aminotransferase|nr:3-phosphoserine/phosphohydroxythreonine transaminase [Polyangiaceae bacterium]
MARVYNFNAGPAALPLAALERARDELIDFRGSGMSIIEHSHRGKEYEAVHDEAEALVRELLSVSDQYHVLFLQGGASQQFAMVPMNFLPQGKSADYILTGGWSEKALDEAKIVGQTRVASTTAEGGKYTRIPAASEIELDPKAAYVHLTSNNTLFGTQWFDFPQTGKVPLVADMSSDFLWRKFDVSRFGLVYAGAQKNAGPSGIVIVIVRKDWVEEGRKDIPKIFRYKTHADNRSLYNTPPTFSVYLVRNVLSWIKDQGGLSAIEKTNREKGRVLYGAIDAAPDFYRAPVEKESRSLMNVVFRLPSEALEEQFVSEAKKAKMVGIKGHRSVGGIRVSTYNAVSLEAVQAMVSFMSNFEKKAKG